MLVQFNKVRILLLGSWLGAAIFFSAVVAPTTFRVLRSFELPNAGEIAGAIVNQTLAVVNTAGFIIGIIFLLSAFAFRRNYTWTSFLIQNLLSAVITIATGISQWVIAAKMRTLRGAMRLPVDQMDLNDPARVAFQALHSYSVAALSIAVIAALILFFVTVNFHQNVEA